jgi:hypothetical protein
VVAGYVFDQTQSYVSVLWGVALTLSASVLLTALLIRPWRAKVAALYSPVAAVAPSS